MRFISTCLVLALLINIGNLYGQKKILVLGSSTSTCFFGPSNFENCYLSQLQRYWQAAGTPVVYDNRAVAGDNVYQGMPTSYTPPPGRNAARPFNNITDGLTGNPDLVLVNYPSNGYDQFSVDEVLFCLRTIKQAANNAGKPCYITTSQPRNDPQSFRTEEVKRRMAEIKERVMSEFGEYAINFWDEIVNPADNSIKPQYNADGTHLNDAGHFILFNRTKDRVVLGSPPPATGNGLTYRYYEGYWNALPDFSALSPVKSGQSGNFDLGVRNREDYFGMVWEGSIRIPASGNYTFEISSDDGSRFYLNSNYNPSASPMLNNDGLHGDQNLVTATVYLNAGVYPIAATFFEAYGNHTFKLFWSGPGISRQEIPSTAFGQNQPSAGGLNYRYYEGDWNTLPDFNAFQPVKTGSVSSIDLGPRNRDDYFGFVWEGYLNVPNSGFYEFEIESDDGGQFFFNSLYQFGHTPTVNNDGLHGSSPGVKSTIYINAGVYPVSASYFDKWGDQVMRLYWTGPGIQRQLIPSSAFRQSPSGFSDRAQMSSITMTEQAAQYDLSGIAKIYPNPFRDRVTVEFNLLSPSANGYLEVYDAFGRLLKTQGLGSMPAGRRLVQLNLHELTPSRGGIYLMKAYLDKAAPQTFKLFRSSQR